MSDARHDAGPEDHPGVLLLTTSFVTVTRLRAAIAREGALPVYCASAIAPARELLTRRRIVALALEPEDARGEATAVLAREFRARDAVPDASRDDSRVAWGRATHDRPPSLVALVRRAAGWTPNALALLGERPDMVAIVEELDARAVARALRPPLGGDDLLSAAWPRLEPDVPMALRPVVRLALARAAAPLPVADFALALGLHRKTLWSQCRRHGVASVQVLMMWCRLIAVTRALRVRRESVERIANELEFASPTALRNATRRYLGVTPSVLREAGGEDLACAGFRRWLRGQSLPAQPSPDAASRLGVTTGDAA